MAAAHVCLPSHPITSSVIDDGNTLLKQVAGSVPFATLGPAERITVKPNLFPPPSLPTSREGRPSGNLPGSTPSPRCSGADSVSYLDPSAWVGPPRWAASMGWPTLVTWTKFSHGAVRPSKDHDAFKISLLRSYFVSPLLIGLC